MVTTPRSVWRPTHSQHELSVLPLPNSVCSSAGKIVLEFRPSPAVFSAVRSIAGGPTLQLPGGLRSLHRLRQLRLLSPLRPPPVWPCRHPVL
ncbi:hypothetical protein U9M48_019128 [Paspalum notatum var. saurae]|uniref:Uncharacterized protein n=1 Tax=Paspalum notatum var. saurae TaxID=547442 RepID=A0AAQ3TD00_PASNO